MKRLVECVPNFSEGRRPEVVDQIVAAIQSAGSVAVLDREMDDSHNRAVVTFVGEPEACLEAAFRGTKKAAELIDLNRHRGEHPRIGATDVCPFIPISGVTNEECVELARRLALRVAQELGIPTYLYELAATRPERQDLAHLRQGEFEGLREAVKTDPRRQPDFGPAELHPTAGAMVVGARFPLIAYNVNLTTPNVDVAKKIAKALRFRDGGLRYCKALGFEIKDKHCAQVSINMTNFTGTGLHRAFEFVKREADRYGVGVRESEIIGLVPQQALLDAAAWYLQLDGFSTGQILEQKLERAQESLADFLDALAAPTPAPGGGSAAALAGAVGASLFSMVAGLTIGKKGSEAVREEMTRTRAALEAMRGRFRALIEEDAAAFGQVMAALKLPKDTSEEKERRATAVQEASKAACAAPLEVMALAVEALEHGSALAVKALKSAGSDVGVGALQLECALKGARLNVLANLSSIADTAHVERARAEATERLEKGEALARQIEAAIR
jgi:glutamate formiminotransferase/formiminotetrahydrofolate cyclodeaminase